VVVDHRQFWQEKVDHNLFEFGQAWCKRSREFSAESEASYELFNGYAAGFSELLVYLYTKLHGVMHQKIAITATNSNVMHENYLL
jgi:hypothetical protein